MGKKTENQTADISPKEAKNRLRSLKSLKNDPNNPKDWKRPGIHRNPCQNLRGDENRPEKEVETRKKERSD